ncbi:MAG TPA: glycosyltransferase family 1 protein [Candidatus Paceibacterota bacterium]|nr:glycosyltransferase family 1 protein [Candidatus Paceibacterota bacterium]
MNICVFTDLRFTAHQKPTGVGKHIFHMLHGLNQIQGNTLYLLAARDQAQHPGSLAFLPGRTLPLSWKLSEALWTVTGHPVADRWCGHPDWVYCPKNDFIPVKHTRVAVTVHGAHELDPQLPQSGNSSARLNRLRRRTSYRRLLQQAALVLTVSEFLKAQMVEWFQVSPEKCRVVGNGVEPEFFRAAEQSPGASGESPDRPFVLAVGGLNYLDGGDRTLHFAAELRKQMPDLRVLVAGSQHERALVARAAQTPNVTLLGYVLAERLARYLRDAVALLFPTRYETFGIAAAEAMATGTPVITCHSTAVPEIVGDAALYTDPDQSEAMVEAVQALLTQPGLRTELIQRGKLRAQAYSWASCVERLQKALVKG